MGSLDLGEFELSPAGIARLKENLKVELPKRLLERGREIMQEVLEEGKQNNYPNTKSQVRVFKDHVTGTLYNQTDGIEFAEYGTGAGRQNYSRLAELYPDPSKIPPITFGGQTYTGYFSGDKVKQDRYGNSYWVHYDPNITDSGFVYTQGQPSQHKFYDAERRMERKLKALLKKL